MGNNLDKRSTGFGFVTGLLVGAFMALLASPKSGRENRRVIMKNLKETKDKLNKKNVNNKNEEVSQIQKNEQQNSKEDSDEAKDK